MKYSIFLILLLLISCLKGDEKEYSKMLSKEECYIVLKRLPKDWRGLTLEGYNPLEEKYVKYKTHNRWWILYVKEMEVGDTIVKRKGGLIFSIHKKDTVIVHKWE